MYINKIVINFIIRVPPKINILVENNCKEKKVCKSLLLSIWMIKL